MTSLTRHEYDENGSESILGIPVEEVTDQWDGEINASGIQLLDAYNVSDFQITGNQSTKQLTLLAQVLNIKSLQRLINPEFKVVQPDNTVVQPTIINRTIGGVRVNKCYKSVGTARVSSYKIGGSVYGGETITIPLTYQQIVDNIDLFPTVTGLLVNTNPVPYQDYGYYIDNGLNVEYPVDRIGYYDSNGNINTFSVEKDIFGTSKVPAIFNMYLVAYKEYIDEPVIVAEVNTSINTTDYTYLRRVHSPGRSSIITNNIITERSTAIAQIQYSSTYTPKYGRLFGAGKNNVSASIAVSFEENANGFLHVSYGGNSSWTFYNSIIRDLNKHEYMMDKNSFYIDSSLIGSGPSSEFTSTDPFTFFGEGWSGEARDTHMPSGFVYYSAIYDRGNTSAVLYPARNSNGVYGLHDVVNDVFYTSDNLALTND